MNSKNIMKLIKVMMKNDKVCCQGICLSNQKILYKVLNKIIHPSKTAIIVVRKIFKTKKSTHCII